jgi:serine/threonine-protein kinase
MESAVHCPTCGKQLESGTRFCPNDGTPLTETAVGTVSQTPAGARPARSAELQLPVELGGRYRLVERRGGGGMATVYRALDLRLEREVAVKLINPELRAESEFDARFQREARIVSQLSDPHIVVVHDFGLDPAHGPFLVMEYLRGQTLRERIRASGPLPMRAGLQLGGQLLLALIHAHNMEVVHRDIKPDNVFILNQSGVRLHIRVLDFGIARIYRGDGGGHDDQPLTHPGAVLGTPRYMAPEQLAGASVDARADLFSAAMVIHEAITGALPFVTGKRFAELCPEAAPELGQLLEQCLRPNPLERPSGAVEVYLRLQELGRASGVLLLPPGALEKLIASHSAGHGSPSEAPTVSYRPPPRSRRWWLWGMLALVVAGAAGTAAVVWFL